MKVLSKVILRISISIIFILLSVQLVSTKTYLMISKDKYSSHLDVDWDYEYAAENIMGYLSGKQDSLVFGSTPISSDILMTERGIAHMEDVRHLYDAGRTIMAISVVLVAVTGIYLWDRKEFWQTLKRLWIFPLVFVGTISIMMAIDFDWAFTLFHKLLFTNDLWMLSWTDPLIVILPIKFFLVTAVIIVSSIVFLHILAILFAHKKSKS